MGLEVKQLNPHSCKTYMLKSSSSDIILIDPVLDHFEDYLKLLRDNSYNLKYVIDTHTHADHISCCAALQDVTDCKYIMHKNAPAKCPNIKIEEDCEKELLPGMNFKFIYSPGHTKDSMSIIVDNNLFTGDALFLDDGGAGRDDLPGGSAELHYETLQKIMNLSEELIVYPAHDYRDRKPSSLKKQKETNPHLKLQSKNEFIQYINDLKLGPADWMKDVLKANYACAQDPKAAWIPVDTPACEVKGTIDKNINEIEIESITTEQLREKIKNNNQPVLIDVREPAELESNLGAIKNSLNIPLLNITQNLVDLSKYENQEVVVICRSGHRASTAAKILKKSGFKNIKVLEGGMLAWNK